MPSLPPSLSSIAGSLPPESYELLCDVHSELANDQRDAVKAIVRERVLEIERLSSLLEMAKAQLQELLLMDATEILMLEQGE
jgi:hypothetical protein